MTEEEADPAAIQTNAIDELRQSAVMIRAWMPEAFPANELGQCHFVRCVMESVADVIDRVLAQERLAPDAQIKHMVSRFLNWRLPENFAPDGGVSFQLIGNEGTPHAYTRVPSGTNLLDAVQAEAMVRHMIDGLPV